MKGMFVGVVGRRSWDKAHTLKALTDGNSLFRYWRIKGQQFMLQRWTDDDMPGSYEDFVNQLHPENSPRVIAAICPQMFGEDRSEQLVRLLTTLKRKYELYFFILRNKGNDPRRTMSEREIHPFEEQPTDCQNLPSCLCK